MAKKASKPPAKKSKTPAKKPHRTIEAQVAGEAALEQAMEAAAIATENAKAAVDDAVATVDRIARKPRLSAKDLVIPSVWRDGGYLVLAYEHEVSKKGAEQVRFFSSFDGEHATDPASFVARMSGMEEAISPARLALNLLARLRVGVCQMRVKTERIFAAMLTVEELAKMSERQLADEYRRIMGEGPARIKADVREKRIQEMIDKVRSDAAKSSDETSTEGKAGDEMSTTKTKGKKAAKKPAAKKAAAKGKTPAATKPVKADSANPFREGSIKAAGFDYFLKHQDDRAKCIEFMVGKGAAAASAASWLSAFRKV